MLAIRRLLIANRGAIAIRVSLATAELGVTAIATPTFSSHTTESRRRFGNMSVVPTPVFFYAMTPGQEVSLEIQAGKTLIINFITPCSKETRTAFSPGLFFS